jgi:hypothetical protein
VLFRSILVNADAALLKGMNAQGLDLNSDPKALAAKERLRARISEMNSAGESTLGHLGAVTMKHLPYAVAQVGIEKAISAGIGKAMEWGGPKITKALPIGDEVKSLIGNRSALASGLRYAGWRKLGTRADLAKKYTDELIHKLIQSKLDEMVKAELKQTFGEALDNLYREVMEENPSQIRRTVVNQPAIYAPLVVQAMPIPVAAAVMPAPPVAAPAVAMPVAVAAPPPVIQISHDRLASSLYVDDSYMRRMLAGERSRPARESSPPAAQAAPPPPPEPPRQPTARELQLHQELMCVGAGNKPGCGSWDGRRGGSLYGH